MEAPFHFVVHTSLASGKFADPFLHRGPVSQPQIRSGIFFGLLLDGLISVEIWKRYGPRESWRPDSLTGAQVSDEAPCDSDLKTIPNDGNYSRSNS